MDKLIAVIIDILLLIIAAVTIYKSYKLGLVRTIIGLTGYLISAFTAMVVSSVLAEFIYDMYLKTRITEKISEHIASGGNIIPDGISSLDMANSVMNSDTVPGFVKNVITGAVGNSHEIAGYIDAEMAKTANSMINITVDHIIGPIVIMFLSSLLFIVIFTLCMIVVRIISKSFKFIDKIPVVGTLNSLLAGAVGVVKAVFYIFIISFAINAIIGITGDSFSYLNTKILENTILLKNIYDISPFAMIKF